MAATYKHLATVPSEDTLTCEAYAKLQQKLNRVMKACTNCKDILPHHWLMKCDSCATRLCDDCITYKNIICVEGVKVCSHCVKELLEKKK